MNNNLSTMGRDRVSALKLSKETGISRTTIHGLYHERTKPRYANCYEVV